MQICLSGLCESNHCRDNKLKFEHRYNIGNQISDEKKWRSRREKAIEGNFAFARNLMPRYIFS